MVFSPTSPDEIDWSTYFPDIKQTNSLVEFLDVGCGYGGLLVTLSQMFPETLTLGLEIRVKVSDYVSDRIKALRSQHEGEYQNIACLRTNAMKYLPNYFRKAQVSFVQIFFCGFCDVFVIVVEEDVFPIPGPALQKG